MPACRRSEGDLFTLSSGLSSILQQPCFVPMTCCIGGIEGPVRNAPFTKSLCERAIYGKEMSKAKAKSGRCDRAESRASANKRPDSSSRGSSVMSSPPPRAKTTSFAFASAKRSSGALETDTEAQSRPMPLTIATAATSGALLNGTHRRAVSQSSSQASVLSAAAATASSSPSTFVVDALRERTDSASRCLHFALPFCGSLH